jgi:hypothetical protein
LAKSWWAAPVKQAINIRRSVEDVFAIIADPAYDHRWSSAVIEAGISTPPPTGVGTTAHYVSRIFGRRLEYDWVITEFELNRRLVGRTEGAPTPARAALSVEPMSDGETRLTVVYWIERGGVVRLIWPLARWLGNRAWRQAFRTLKELMEANAL